MAPKQSVLVTLLLGFAPFIVQGQLFLSSSRMSWTQDDEGRVHQEIHQMQDEVIPHGGIVTHSRSEMACHDGNCQKRVVVSGEPSQTDGMRLFVFLDRIADRGCGKHKLRSRFSSFPAQEVDTIPPTPPQHIAPSPTKDVATQQGPNNLPEFWEVMGPALFAAVIVSAAASLVLYFACCMHSPIDARELPLAALAEPLVMPASPSVIVALASVPPAVALTVGTIAEAGAKEEEVGETAETAFALRPSVGTWLCQRLIVEEEEEAERL
eukprot:TRINITY_DN4104_c0_g1_i1.p1 TRINITY_DN4104_c0_g1~~TRINITY_DN4104_c0_g1_i1.p1  ORF type:complete len:290 (+),score=42.89 TRINITY_DN4104_c0_g1_i1:72-872(+)